MSPRPNVSEERKHQILDAALNVFNRKGITKTRMDDIVEEASLSKGALYWYFKSKDEIVIGILGRFFKNELKELEKLRSASGSAVDHLWQFSEGVISDVKKMLKFMPLAYELYALAFHSTIIQKFFKEYLNFFLDCLEPIIQRGIESGEFRSVDARQAAIAAGAIFEGTLLLWVYDNTVVDPEKHIRSGMKLLLEGLQTKA